MDKDKENIPNAEEIFLDLLQMEDEQKKNFIFGIIKGIALCGDVDSLGKIHNAAQEQIAS